jgi:uncharacterized RDD family membrane protein YckC
LKGIEYKIIGGDGREYGPVTLDELRDWIGDGRVGSATRVWQSEDGVWQPASERSELRWDLPTVEAPPVLPVRPEERSIVQPAHFAARGAAYLFDALLVSLLVGFISLPWNTDLAELQKAMMETMRQQVPDHELVIRFYALVLGFHLPVSLFYHVGCNTAFGGTPGKLLIGLRILRTDGSKLTFTRALIRYLAEALSLAPLGAGYLLALFHPTRQALHDLVADTCVVRPARLVLGA